MRPGILGGPVVAPLFTGVAADRISRVKCEYMLLELKKVDVCGCLADTRRREFKEKRHHEVL